MNHPPLVFLSFLALFTISLSGCNTESSGSPQDPSKPAMKPEVRPEPKDEPKPDEVQRTEDVTEDIYNERGFNIRGDHQEGHPELGRRYDPAGFDAEGYNPWNFNSQQEHKLEVEIRANRVPDAETFLALIDRGLERQAVSRIMHNNLLTFFQLEPTAQQFILLLRTHRDSRREIRPDPLHRYLILRVRTEVFRRGLSDTSDELTQLLEEAGVEADNLHRRRDLQDAPPAERWGEHVPLREIIGDVLALNPATLITGRGYATIDQQDEAPVAPARAPTAPAARDYYDDMDIGTADLYD